VNTYWRSVAGRVLVSAAGRAYRTAVAQAMHTQRVVPQRPLSARLAVVLTVFPPDARRRDLDNLLKATLDALTAAGIWADDALIDDLRIQRGAIDRTAPRLELHVVPIPFTKAAA
jgi:crossover junction endodeoxyribonuclease RusA